MPESLDFAPNIAIFCDFENVAIGVRDAKFEKFDVHLVLERVLDKGKIVVKKAYADWERYKSSRRPLHEAAFELIEIPHVSYSGKNSADIRLVVDALDLCYTKAHVDVFCIVSGDSDFSPLVSKLRENNKKVIGLGVKNSSSDLLIENCDEFIYYDDLVREKAAEQRKAARNRERERERAREREKKASASASPSAAASASGSASGSSGSGAAASGAANAATHAASADKPKNGDGAAGAAGAAHGENGIDEKKDKALEMVLDIVDALFRERDDNLWGSMVKQTLKRKRPTFSETFHGYRNFNELLEDAQGRGLLELQKDEKSGGYIILAFGPNA